MIKVWGRNTSSNVQKVMWAVGELDLPHQRIDVGGAFGKNKEAPYLAMNPNGLVPTLEEEDGFTSVGIELDRALSRGPPRQPHARARGSATRALAHKWMDWQLSVMGPALTAGILGIDPHAAGEARCQCHCGRQEQEHRGRADARPPARRNGLSRRRRALPMATFRSELMIYRYRRLIPERPRTAQPRPLVRSHLVSARHSRARSASCTADLEHSSPSRSRRPSVAQVIRIKGLVSTLPGRAAWRLQRLAPQQPRNLAGNPCRLDG